MTKKAHNLKVAIEEVKQKRRLSNQPSRSLASNQVARATSSSSTETVGQVSSSDEQALECLLESIVTKLADSPQEQREMAEFLNMVLETDPELRREIIESRAMLSRAGSARN